MSEVIATPDYDRANGGTLQGIIAQALSQFKAGLDNCLPARIISYDRTTNRASVQPQIQMVTSLGESVMRAPLADVPVYTAGGGGFNMNFPLPAGASGWIKANDRDVSLYLQSGMNVGPNTRRMHSFSDAVFYPDPHGGLTVSEEDANSAVIQSTDNNVRISLGTNGGVKITTPAGTFEMDGFDHLLANIGGSSLSIESGLITLTATVVNVVGILKVNGVVVTVP